MYKNERERKRIDCNDFASICTSLQYRGKMGSNPISQFENFQLYRSFTRSMINWLGSFMKCLPTHQNEPSHNFQFNWNTSVHIENILYISLNQFQWIRILKRFNWRSLSANEISNKHSNFRVVICVPYHGFQIDMHTNCEKKKKLIPNMYINKLKTIPW